MAESDGSKMQIDSGVGATEIDEGLYSRQLYVLGHEAMKRMGASNILVAGLKGLGVEIAKNIALAGVKSLSLYDPAPAALADLSSQFFIRPDDVGKPRDQVTAARVAELNSYVPIQIHQSAGLDQNLQELDKYQVVILTNTPLKTQIVVGDYCHSKGIHIVAADAYGLFGSVFCDFGKNFTVLDATGENPQSGIISGIDDEGIVSVHEDSRHGLEDGDYVTFSELQGMEALNGCEPKKVTVQGPFTFSIGDVSGLGQYKRGGLYQQVKMPVFMDFKSFSESLREPEFLISDYSKFNHPQQLHIGFQALHAFAEANGRLPGPMDEKDALVLLESAKKFAEKEGVEVEFDEKLIKELAFQATGDLNPIAAFLGGIAAQEVLKAVSGKFHPLKQWMYFDSLESLPLNARRTPETCRPTGTRYDGQIAVFGTEFQEKIANTKEFLVGAGAIGCEMLKNWAMIGLGTGPKGGVWVTDLDSIERSNLNRQFLFRAADVGKMKSDCAAQAVADMNPELIGKMTALKDRIDKETENVFNENFWKNLDGVTNALDNVEARRYVDERCVFFSKPLLESGTLGTKGNTQVVIPNMTESYSSSQDPPEIGFPMCILRSFPNKIEHCIHWAMENIFETNFTRMPGIVNTYLTQPGYLDKALRQPGGPNLPELQSIQDSLTTDRPRSFDDCIAWARLRFEQYFVNDIQQLLHNFPKDYETGTGTPFWSGPKRAPDPLKFDAENPTHFGFIETAANLHAFNYSIKASNNDKAMYMRVLENVIVPDFTPNSDVKIQTDDKEPDPNAGAFNDQEELEKVVAAIPPVSRLAGFQLSPVEFEKDDDTNYHIDFITMCSNLRAENYKIQTLDRHQTKLVAGKIIPAIATTTALVTGLVILELFKLIDGKNDIEQFKNGFVNLALPFFGFSEPIASRKVTYKGPGGVERSLDRIWGRFEIGDVTLQEFINEFSEKHGLSISMLSSGVSLVYGPHLSPAVLESRKGLKMSELIEKVSRKKIPDHQSDIVVVMVADDSAGEDVDVPFVKVQIR